jgi:hypothetical protein
LPDCQTRRQWRQQQQQQQEKEEQLQTEEEEQQQQEQWQARRSLCSFPCLGSLCSAAAAWAGCTCCRHCPQSCSKPLKQQQQQQQQQRVTHHAMKPILQGMLLTQSQSNSARSQRLQQLVLVVLRPAWSRSSRSLALPL